MSQVQSTYPSGLFEGAGASAAMMQALMCSGPRPELEKQLALFGQFVGSWDLEVTSYPEPGLPKLSSGEWHFGWALEGRAILDVWISPRREERGDAKALAEGDYGATLRFFDASIEAIRSTWIGPRRGIVRPFIARREGDEIVLRGSFAPAVETRWIFSDIRPDSFHWRYIESGDGWKSQRLWQEMSARRSTTH